MDGDDRSVALRSASKVSERYFCEPGISWLGGPGRGRSMLADLRCSRTDDHASCPEIGDACCVKNICLEYSRERAVVLQCFHDKYVSAVRGEGVTLPRFTIRDKQDRLSSGVQWTQGALGRREPWQDPNSRTDEGVSGAWECRPTCAFVFPDVPPSARGRRYRGSDHPNRLVPGLVRARR